MQQDPSSSRIVSRLTTLFPSTIFDAVVEFDYDNLGVEEFVDVEYRTWIQVFEEEFPEAELYYPDPDNYL